MSLINITTDNSVNAIQNRNNKYIQDQITNVFLQMQRTHMSIWHTIWKNSQLTPEQVITGLGTNAYPLFQLATINATALGQAISIGGSGISINLPGLPSGYNIVPNQDGSVVLISPSGI